MTKLQDRNDAQAIETVYAHYCTVIDSKDFTGLREVFLPDAVQDYRSSNGILEFGVEPLITRLTRNMGHGSLCGETAHSVSNIRIKVDGDTARAKARFHATHHGLEHFVGKRYACWGEYSDDWVRTDDGWRITRRHYRNTRTEGPVEIIRGRPAPAS
ncbi:nuclear transport factor 2 family protein [Croceicoccus naphthovorans]|uniref:Uncharacterized protein n=1 Tax=Croceicoccus naphthovorans TaxID=1348774 RepID=A0A0G3XE22_9SPHN|nr:nuclear transport factor 2 family protein [Croceicoccus naphthovorans]AKM09447.1 hypothetical protein AB433_04770 [Croceicoccus naphthovorans]MBB3991553.1 ketosteroid isomerase-like protein [Croceicoccus naphthovorans]